MRILATILGTAALFLLLPRTAAAAPPVLKRGSLSPFVREATDMGPLPLSRTQQVVVGLALRNRDQLEAFLADVQDPASPNYRRFLTQEEFNARFAPVPEDEQAVAAYLEQNGLTVARRFPNRLLIDARGSVAAIERAFGVRLHAVRFRGKSRFAALREPALPVPVASMVTGVLGLDDLNEMVPHVRGRRAVVAPHAAVGADCCHLSPNDLRTFYNNTTGLDGSGQTVVIAGAYAWKDSDNTAFNTEWSLPALPAGSGQVCTGSGSPGGCQYSSLNSIEIALDVEYAHGTAPGATILNYMAASTSFSNFTVMYNRIVTDDPGHVVSTSWGACESVISESAQQTNDDIFANGNAIGQSWFAASGDNGSRDCDDVPSVDHPANSPHVIGVGGTTPTCSGGMTTSDPACAGYGSETGWSDSGGGVSTIFSRPSFQTGCGVPSGSERLVPDVSLDADTSPGVYVITDGSWISLGGTSGATPQWAGYLAMRNQLAGGSGLGNPGALLYALCGTAAYHDITTGSNGDYTAGAGYDLVTGLGTIDAAAFLSGSQNIPTLSWKGAAVLALLILGAFAVALPRRRRPGSVESS